MGMGLMIYANNRSSPNCSIIIISSLKIKLVDVSLSIDISIFKSLEKKLHSMLNSTLLL